MCPAQRKPASRDGRRRVLTHIAPEADIASLSPDADLREALEIDSFDFLNLLVGVDRALGVAIPEADYGQVTTLARLTEYVSARRQRS